MVCEERKHLYFCRKQLLSQIFPWGRLAEKPPITYFTETVSGRVTAECKIRVPWSKPRLQSQWRSVGLFLLGLQVLWTDNIFPSTGFTTEQGRVANSHVKITGQQQPMKRAWSSWQARHGLRERAHISICLMRQSYPLAQSRQELNPNPSSHHRQLRASNIWENSLTLMERAKQSGQQQIQKVIYLNLPQKFRLAACFQILQSFSKNTPKIVLMSGLKAILAVGISVVT